MILIIRNIEFENNCNVKSIKQIWNKICIHRITQIFDKRRLSFITARSFYACRKYKEKLHKASKQIKEFLPKTGTVRMLILTENQFSSCVLFQEEVDLQEYHVGAKDLVTL